jgi:hypothetical protein
MDEDNYKKKYLKYKYKYLQLVDANNQNGGIPNYMKATMSSLLRAAPELLNSVPQLITIIINIINIIQSKDTPENKIINLGNIITKNKNLIDKLVPVAQAASAPASAPAPASATAL